MSDFSTRNAYYLRVSNYKVIPLFLYLDERHVDWMSKGVLGSVIDDLQPKMKELLLNARAVKKHRVHVERGEGYQYCYFLRNSSKTEVVLLKHKTYSLRPPTPPPPAAPLDSEAGPSRSRRVSRSRTRTRSMSLVPAQAVEVGMEEDVKPDISGDLEPSAAADGGEEDEERERNIKDYKPDISLSYKGFGTSMHQLVVIVEPYPPLPASSYAPPSSRLSSRSASVASYSRSRTAASRAYAGASRASSVSLSVEPQQRMSASVQAPNMRNASRSISSTPVPNSRRGGTVTASATPLREASSTPGPYGLGGAWSGRDGSRGPTPLFIPSDTPFDQDEEDEIAHQAMLEAVRNGRMRLPSVSRPAGAEEGMNKTAKRSLKRRIEQEEEEEGEEDEPEGVERLGERLSRNSEVEDRVVRVYGGWEERGEGEESAVMGREMPGE